MLFAVYFQGYKDNAIEELKNIFWKQFIMHPFITKYPCSGYSKYGLTYLNGS
jgi:hypothetical protein